MANNANKRGAAEASGSDTTKKTRTAVTKKDEDEDDIEPMQITSQLWEKFDKYPNPPRETIEEKYTDEVYFILERLQNGKSVTHSHTYHIINGVRTNGTSASDYKTAQAAVFLNASMANVAVLEQFIKDTPARKTAFVQAPKVKLANPDFAALHSVPHGHMGWGFDKDGCLSLHLTKIENNRLKHLYIYVESKVVEGVKVEDDECRIVDDPNGANY